jgi:hypothetical protein
MYGILLPYNKELADNSGGLLDVHVFDGRDGKQMIIGDVYELDNNTEPVIVPEIDKGKKISASILMTTIFKNCNYNTDKTFEIYYIKKY